MSLPPGTIGLSDARDTDQLRHEEEVLREKHAFGAFVVDQQSYVVRLVQRLYGWECHADVDDIVQDVFVAAWQHRETFRGDAHARTWLTRIVINTTRNRQRRLRSATNALHRIWKAMMSRSQNGSAENHGVHAYEMERLVGAGIEVEDPRIGRMRDAMRQLRPPDREILVVRYLEELSIDDIAAVLSIQRNSVDARLSRARRRLAQLMERNNE